MKKYEDFIDGLQENVKVPDKVWSQYEETLEDIEHLAQKRKEGHNNEMNRKFTDKTWIKAAAAVGILVACGGVFCYNNPVAASNLPIIGKIFEQVEEDVTYSGDYAKKEVLQDVIQVEDTAEKSVYTAKNKGITITASEVYCDGYSIYLTAKIESKKGGFNNIPSYFTRRFGDKTSQIISTDGAWEVNGEEEIFPSSNDFEGKAVDDNTFIGMIKIDMEQYSANDGTLHLKLSDIWYDEEENMNDNIEPSTRIKGNWELVVPYSVDKEQTKEILVNKKNKDGYRIQKVFVSPYQVIVFSDVPYTTLSADDYTKEDFENTWAETNKELIANGEKPVTYEEVLEEKRYDYYELAVYNQEGEALEMQYSDNAKTVFAVQEHKLSKLHIYMGDEAHEMELIKAANEQEAKEKSILDVEVDLK